MVGHFRFRRPIPARKYWWKCLAAASAASAISNHLKRDSGQRKNDTAIAEKVSGYKEYVQEEQMGALAEYVLKRKAVIDLLDKFWASKTLIKSDVISTTLCTHSYARWINSKALAITDHNLWLADDRLAFFSFFASDIQRARITMISPLQR
jgi:hypothetical protein